MKLIIAIVQDEDSTRLTEALTTEGFSATKLATTGGFLRLGNTTLLIGVEEDRFDGAISIIEHVCKSRKQVTGSPTFISGSPNLYTAFPVEVTVGGATVFVLNVEQFLHF